MSEDKTITIKVKLPEKDDLLSALRRAVAKLLESK
mgnify:CR=1 FL=1